MTYQTARPAPPARLLIRIRRRAATWRPVPLLATSPGWVQVDDGNGPLWLAFDQVHPGDRERLATFERLKQSQN